MECIAIEDLEWLTKVENRLIRLRKREAANEKRLCYDITESIEKIHWLRQMTQGRLNLPVDKGIDS